MMFCIAIVSMPPYMHRIYIIYQSVKIHIVEASNRLLAQKRIPLSQKGMVGALLSQIAKPWVYFVKTM